LLVCATNRQRVICEMYRVLLDQQLLGRRPRRGSSQRAPHTRQLHPAAGLHLGPALAHLGGADGTDDRQRGPLVQQPRSAFGTGGRPAVEQAS